jgi:hypothetical protein
MVERGNLRLRHEMSRRASRDDGHMVRVVIVIRAIHSAMARERDVIKRGITKLSRMGECRLSSNRNGRMNRSAARLGASVGRGDAFLMARPSSVKRLTMSTVGRRSQLAMNTKFNFLP